MINSKIIAADPTMPDTKMFAREFASLPRAYNATGLPRSPAFAAAETRKKLSVRWRESVDCVVEHAQNAGATVERTSVPSVLSINGSLLVRVNVEVCCNLKRGLQYWKLTTQPGIDFIIIERINSAVLNTVDYLLVPVRHLLLGTIYLETPNLIHYSALRYSSVGAIFGDVTTGHIAAAC